MNRSQKLIERMSTLSTANEKLYIHTFNRNVHRNPGTISDPLDFHPAVGSEASAYGAGSLVSHVKNSSGQVIKTHVIKQSEKNPHAYEHHVYKFNKGGDSAGSVRHHSMTSHHSQADAILSANRSSADRLLKRATQSAKAAVAPHKSSGTSFAKSVIKHIGKTALGV